MSERETFLAAIEADPENDDCRHVYADWLDEHGEEDEADRQRRYLPAVRWLKDFAKNDEEFNWDYRYAAEYGREPGQCTGDDYWYCCGFHQLIHFLEAHEEGSMIEGQFYLGFDTPHGWNNYSEELWENYEIVTGNKAPEGQYRTEMPPFRCAC